MTYKQVRNELMGLRWEWIMGGGSILFILVLGAWLVTEWTGWRAANLVNQEVSGSLVRKSRNPGVPFDEGVRQERLPLSVGNIFNALTLDNYMAMVAARKARMEADKARQAAEEDARRRASRTNTVCMTVVTNIMPRKAVSAVKPAPPRYVDINFQGLIKMSDGQEFAIVGIAPTGITVTCKTGERCVGVLVERLCRDEIALKLPDGEVCLVSRGGVLHVEEKRLYAQ